MNIFYLFVELFATLAESFIIFCTAIAITNPKYSTKSKQFISILIVCIIYSSIITFLNTFNLFSFLTIYIGMASFCILNYFVTNTSILQRAMATVISFLVLATFDYSIGFASALIFEDSPNIYTGFTIL